MSTLEAKNRKCLFSVLNRDFIIGFEAFAASLRKNNPWTMDIGLEILIVSVDLSDSDKKKCENLYPFIRWLKPHDPPSIFNQDNTKIGISAFHKLRVFDISEYDSIVSIDCGDMIVLKNIATLFSYDVSIGMVQGWTPVMKWQQFNGGLVVLNKTYRNRETYNRLISYPPSPFYDQQILNDEFSKEIVRLPVDFNFSKRMIECDELNLEDAKILHFVGEKPWNDYEDKLLYKKVEDIWNEYGRTKK
jgi:lipopolysaccharide biosynthesis glycosyltransferase